MHLCEYKINVKKGSGGNTVAIEWKVLKRKIEIPHYLARALFNELICYFVTFYRAYC